MSVVSHRVRRPTLALLLFAFAVRLGAQTALPGDDSGRDAARRVQAATPAQPQPPRRSWIRRHPVIVGALVGAGAIAAAGAAGRGNRNAGIMGMWVLAGAGGGALAGSIVSTGRKATSKYDPSTSQPDILEVKRIVAQLGSGEGVIVMAANARQTKGRIQSVGQDEFVVVPDGQTAPVHIAYADVRSVRAKPAGAGKKAGIAAGIVGGIVLSWLVCFGAGGCGGSS